MHKDLNDLHRAPASARGGGAAGAGAVHHGAGEGPRRPAEAREADIGVLTRVAAEAASGNAFHIRLAEDSAGACAGRGEREGALGGGEEAEATAHDRVVPTGAEVKRDKGGEGDVICNVCWEPLRGAGVARLDCAGQHSFCTRCIVRWFHC